MTADTRIPLIFAAALSLGFVLVGCPTEARRSQASAAPPAQATPTQTDREAGPTAPTPAAPAGPVWQQVVSDDPAARTIAVTLGDPQQIFHGFGTSFLNCNRWTDTTPAEIHRELAQRVWGHDGLSTMRTWLYLPETLTAPDTVDTSAYVRRYIDSRLIPEARAAGCTGITVVPAQFPRWMRLEHPEAVVPVVDGHQENRVMSDANITVMMEGIAEAIRKISEEQGIAIAATGIQNEPNSDHGDSGYITIAQTPLAVKSLRAALDRRQLQSVAIIAPETSSVDWAFTERIAALRADPAAWDALAGVAWHSYNMAMTPAAIAGIREAGKELWMTEASANGPEPANDRVAAAAMAARIANDMRYGAGTWIWFLGYEGHDPKDDQTRLIRIFQERQPVTCEELGKFHPLKDLCAAFPPGSTVLTTASPDLAPWTYGRKPVLQAVAARRPDGGLALAAVDFTAPDFPAAGATGDFAIENAGLPAQVLRVDWRLPVESGAAHVRRRDADLATPIDELLPVRDGHLILTVRPLEIVTVVIDPAPAPAVR